MNSNFDSFDGVCVHTKWSDIQSRACRFRRIDLADLFELYRRHNHQLHLMKRAAAKFRLFGFLELRKYLRESENLIQTEGAIVLICLRSKYCRYLVCIQFFNNVCQQSSIHSIRRTLKRHQQQLQWTEINVENEILIKILDAHGIWVNRYSRIDGRSNRRLEFYLVLNNFFFFCLCSLKPWNGTESLFFFFFKWPKSVASVRLYDLHCSSATWNKN